MRLKRDSSQLMIAILVQCCLVLPASAQSDRRLLQKTTLEYDNALVVDVLKELAERHKLKLSIDPAVEQDRANEKPVLIHAEGILLGAALNRLQAVSGLVCSLDRGELKVVTRAADDVRLYPIRYTIGTWAAQVADQPQLHGLIMDMTGGSWQIINGQGGLIGDLTPQGMVIEQSSRVHEEIRRLLEEISVRANGRTPAPTPADRTAAKILQILQRPVGVMGEELRLEEFCKQVFGTQKVGWQIDVIALSEEGIRLADVQVTLPADKTPVGSVLAAALREKGLTYWIVDEVVFVTSQNVADETLTTRVYHVGNKLNQGATMYGLTQQLQNIEELGAWKDTDGEGGALFPLGQLLIIRQTAAAHSELTKLLQ